MARAGDGDDGSGDRVGGATTGVGDTPAPRPRRKMQLPFKQISQTQSLRPSTGGSARSGGSRQGRLDGSRLWQVTEQEEERAQMSKNMKAQPSRDSHPG